MQRGAAPLDAGVRLLDDDDIEDLDEAPEDEVEAIGEEILDQATAARHRRGTQGRDRHP